MDGTRVVRVMYVDGDEVMLTMVERLLEFEVNLPVCFKHTATLLTAPHASTDILWVPVTVFHTPDLPGLELARQHR